VTGRHRAPSSTRPYTAAALLAAALALAGGGAVLRHQVLERPPADAGAAAGAVTDAAASASASPGSSGSPAAPGSPAPPTGTPTPSPTPAAAATRRTSPSPPRPAPSTTRPRSQVERLEDEVTALVNQERAKAGCGAVRTDERLRTAARGHSADMAANNYFSHTALDGSSPGDRARRAGYTQWIGENIAYGYRTPADVMRGWMDSSGHRSNILNCSARAIGVGLAYSPNGTPYWTQMFGAA
jgi:uncharacterized protein YkwD